MTFDPGLADMAGCRSAVTFLDGPHGVLQYRCRNVEELARFRTWSEVTHLFVEGALPSPEQRRSFDRQVDVHARLENDEKRLIDALPWDSKPLPSLAAVTAVVLHAGSTRGETDGGTARGLLGKLPTLAAAIHGRLTRRRFTGPRDELDAAGNLLHMLTDAPSGLPAPRAARALGTLLVLRADPGPDRSTRILRLLAGAGAGLTQSVVASLLSLSGSGDDQPRRVLEGLEPLARLGCSAETLIEELRKRFPTRQLPGFGHPVFKTYDPRAAILKHVHHRLLPTTGRSRLTELALRLEETALGDEFFVTHGLYPNADFYSGLLLHALGIPRSAFSLLDAIARVPAWIAHWMEQAPGPPSCSETPHPLHRSTGETPLPSRRERP